MVWIMPTAAIVKKVKVTLPQCVITAIPVVRECLDLDTNFFVENYIKMKYRKRNEITNKTKPKLSFIEQRHRKNIIELN